MLLMLHKLQCHNYCEPGYCVLFVGGERTTVVFCYLDEAINLRSRSPPLVVVKSVGGVRTVAPPLQRTLSQITDPIEITIKRKLYLVVWPYLIILIPDFRCSNLRSKMFGLPSPYLKFQVRPPRGVGPDRHHGQRTDSTALTNQINPAWREVSCILKRLRF